MTQRPDKHGDLQEWGPPQNLTIMPDSDVKARLLEKISLRLAHDVVGRYLTAPPGYTVNFATILTHIKRIHRNHGKRGRLQDFLSIIRNAEQMNDAAADAE